MFCMKCQNNLVNCECPDLPERLAAISGKVIFDEESARQLSKQIERVQGMNELKEIGNERK